MGNTRIFLGLLDGAILLDPLDTSILLDPFKLSVVEIFIPPVADAKALSTPQQMEIILMDPLWVNIVKDKVRKDPDPKA